MKKLFSFVCVCIWIVLPSYANNANAEDFDAKANGIIKAHFQKYQNDEYFSGIGVAISLPKQPVRTYAIGHVAHNKNSPKISADSLFEMGSISKSYTSALILKLVSKNKLNLTDKVRQFLPDYKKWGNITIEQLLNMTSGLPNYSDSPAWNYLESKNISRYWSDKELLDFVYPSGAMNPPLKDGYFYTNTGYTIAGMILHKITKKTYAELLQQEIFEPLNLKNTYYLISNKNSKEYGNMVHGYAYNQYDNPSLVGRDLRNNNLSWAGPAGGLVATLKDITLWVRQLFNDEIFLDDKSRKALMQLVSTDTGKPIRETSTKYPRGFALGVAENYMPKIGRFWFYEGETLGFRTLYMYTPCNAVIISASFNSATNSENDHAHLLLIELYQRTLKSFPQYQCRSVE